VPVTQFNNPLEVRSCVDRQRVVANAGSAMRSLRSTNSSTRKEHVSASECHAGERENLSKTVSIQGNLSSILEDIKTSRKPIVGVN
jgi:hypothetical protein